MNAAGRTAGVLWLGLAVWLGLDGPCTWGQDKAQEMSDQERKQLAQQATNLFKQGVEQYRKGRLDEAIRSTEQCLTLLRKLYPSAKYPDGHPDLAASLNALGYLLEARGDYARAEPFYRDSLAMRQKLYPREKYPDGHPHLATACTTWASCCRRGGSTPGPSPSSATPWPCARSSTPRGSTPTATPNWP
jgi:tetratricopeptide (TPR) repeat protein